MHPARRLVAVGAALFVVSLSGACADDPLAPEPEAGRPRLTASDLASVSLAPGTIGHVIVLRSQSSPSSELLAAIDSAGGRIVSRYDRIGVLIVDGLSDAEAGTLAGRVEIEAASRDEMMQWHPLPEALRIENPVLEASAANPAGAFFYEDQWNMRQIQADRAWETTPRGEGVLVCILDSGIDPTHVDLAGKVDLTRSASFVAEPVIPEFGLNGQFDILDYFFHGTFVASQVATNGLGMASVAPEATLCVIKVLNVFGSGPFAGVVGGLMYAADVGADVINLSLGLYVDVAAADDQLKALLLATQRAVLHAIGRGAMVVASAGNDAVNLDADGSRLHIPSQLLGVVSVSATGPTNQIDFDGLAAYSNFGRTGVALAAPGGNAGATGDPLDGLLGACSSFQLVLPFPCLTSSFLSGGDGTSFAAPHVTGLAAVVESATRRDTFGVLLAACAIRGADRLDGEFLSPLYGFGRIDVFDSVRQFGCGKDFRDFERFW
ncbi:MAG: S8 family serine peptidase [Longimicrobiales bacterium]